MQANKNEENEGLNAMQAPTTRKKNKGLGTRGKKARNKSTQNGQ